ncbi:MAG: carbohydrate ABC transporter permease, partial [Pseudomonadota bacterium]
MSRADQRARFWLHVLVLTLVLIILFPFLWLLMMSFKSDSDIFAWPPVIVFTPTIDHYAALWQGNFPKSFANSAIASIVSTVLAMLAGVPGAYALSRTAMRSEKSLSLLILSSRMAPPIAFTIPYFLVYRHLDLLDTLTGLIIIYLTFNISLVVWLMRSFFDAT